MLGTRVSRRAFLVRAATGAGLALLSPVASACAPKTPEPKAEPVSTAPVQQAQAAAPATDGITLRFLAYAGRWGTHQIEFARRFAEENKPKVKEVVIEEGDTQNAPKKIEAYLVTGTMPDAGYVDTAFFPYLAVKGAFQAIDEQAASAGLDLSKRFNQSFYGKFTDGKSMAIGGAAGLTPAMVVYNKTMAQDKGVKLPHDDWTIDEFEEFVIAMSDKDKGIFGSYYIFDGSHGCDGWFRRWGGRFLSEDGKTCMFADPKTQDGIKWQMRMIKEGYWAGREDVTEGANKMFVTGGLASYVTNASMAGSAKEGIGDAFEYDFVLLPKGPLCEDTSPCRGFAPYANAIWSSSQTEYPDLAFGMQAMVTSPECAKWSVYNLGRNPGSDMSVWRDPEILKDYPVWGKIADLMESPAGQFPMPDNLRYMEYWDVGNAEYGALGYGDVEYNEANVMEAQTKVQEILDLPRP